jgi:uncharacterized protein involved in type VI secretion and phage assembly
MPDDGPQQALVAQLSRLYGKYRGVVTENVDPERLGRLRVQVPALQNEEPVWARPCVPFAGKDVGLFVMPKVKGLVWIEFEAGDKDFPIWTGALWAVGDIDPADASPDIKFLKTEKFTLRIDDAEGQVTLKIGDKSEVVITASEIRVKSSSIKNEAEGGRKTALTSSSFSVNDAALEVL